MSPGTPAACRPSPPPCRFNFVCQVLPFLLVGVGIDNAFVIISSYFDLDPDAPVERRCMPAGRAQAGGYRGWRAGTARPALQLVHARGLPHEPRQAGRLPALPSPTAPIALAGDAP